jgi:tRNA A37 threonylcarbamoyladenosine modification protein TsaB
MDARMGEVYWGAFQPGAAHAAEAVGDAPSMLHALRGQSITAAAGKGLAAFPDSAVSLQLPADRTFATAEPHARVPAQRGRPAWEIGLRPDRCKMAVTHL